MAPRRQLNALGRHLALAGFMGSGKTTVGEAVSRRLGRPFVDLDREIEARAGSAVAELFASRGEPGFRALEEDVARDVLRDSEPVVVALGGGAVLSERTRNDLAARAFTVLLDVDSEVAWTRVAGSGRPLAQEPEEFHALHRDRQPLYEEVADATPATRTRSCSPPPASTSRRRRSTSSISSSPVTARRARRRCARRGDPRHPRPGRSRVA